MLFSDYFLTNREENYRHLVPKVIVEPILFNTTNINDYKIFCFTNTHLLMLCIRNIKVDSLEVTFVYSFLLNLDIIPLKNHNYEVS